MKIKLSGILLLTTLSFSALAEAGTEAVIETDQGSITLELYQQQAPETVNNFRAYAESGFYDGLIFHRVIPGFMIQGGGFTAGMNRKETLAPVKNEGNNGVSNSRGTIAMARTMDPDSATSQFFINQADNRFLDSKKGKPGYAVFGKVTKGMDVVDRIAAVPTGNKGQYQNVPLTPVLIKSIKIHTDSNTPASQN